MTSRNAHYFQHVPFEGLGYIEDWLTANEYRIEATPLWQSDHRLPDSSEVDFLILMGGPMSVNDEATYPWLTPEKQFIRDFLATGKPVLGICLGAQLIASALGATVTANPQPEIGWYPVFGSGADGGFAFPDETLVFHWHGETFSLPEGAISLAHSHGCRNQAFQLGTNVIGLQCHPETTPASASALVKHCGDELVDGEFIQSAGQILFADTDNYRQANSLMTDILEYLTARSLQ